MTDGATAFEPGADEVAVPFRPRSEYTGYRAFGSGDGAVLMAPLVAHDLRSAAKLATAQRRIAGGLLYGRGWADELGTYLVIDHYVEAGAGDSGDAISGDGDGYGDFTLSEDGLRQLREEAARAHSGSLEAGWWRTCAAPGEFGPGDFVTQGELVGRDGVGLLVYGSGVYWGTAYLGPDGHAPDSAGTLAAVPDPVTGPDAEPPPGPGPAPAQAAGVVPEPEVVDIAAGESLEQEPPLTGTARPRRRRGTASGYGAPRRRRRAASGYGPPRGYGALRRRGGGLGDGDAPEPAADLPADAQFVVGALMAVVVAAAIIVGFIVSSLIVAVIIGAAGILVIVSTVWISHHY
jgi:hypothetical protein